MSCLIGLLFSVWLMGWSCRIVLLFIITNVTRQINCYQLKIKWISMTMTISNNDLNLRDVICRHRLPQKRNIINCRLCSLPCCLRVYPHYQKCIETLFRMVHQFESIFRRFKQFTNFNAITNVSSISERNP